MRERTEADVRALNIQENIIRADGDLRRMELPNVNDADVEIASCDGVALVPFFLSMVPMSCSGEADKLRG
jgi:hypothetical protein